MDLKIVKQDVVPPPYAMPSGPGMSGGLARKNGILKTRRIVPTSSPTKAPTRKRSVYLVSEKKLRSARKTAKHRADHMDIGKIRKSLIERNIISDTKRHIPSSVLRTLYQDSVGAGLIS